MNLLKNHSLKTEENWDKHRQMNGQDPEPKSHTHRFLIIDSRPPAGQGKVKLRKRVGTGLFLQHDFCKEHHFLPSSLSERPSSVVLSILFILTSIYLSNCGNQFFTCLCLQHPTCCWAHNGSETELRVRGPIETGGDHLQWWELPLLSKTKALQSCWKEMAPPKYLTLRHL